MRSNVLKITDFHKLIISTPINRMAARVTRSGPHDPPPKDKEPTISASDLRLFRQLFGWRQNLQSGQRRSRNRRRAA